MNVSKIVFNLLLVRSLNWMVSSFRN